MNNLNRAFPIKHLLNARPRLEMVLLKPVYDIDYFEEHGTYREDDEKHDPEWVEYECQLWADWRDEATDAKISVCTYGTIRPVATKGARKEFVAWNFKTFQPDLIRNSDEFCSEDHHDRDCRFRVDFNGNDYANEDGILDVLDEHFYEICTNFGKDGYPDCAPYWIEDGNLPLLGFDEPLPPTR